MSVRKVACSVREFSGALPFLESWLLSSVFSGLQTGEAALGERARGAALLKCFPVAILASSIEDRKLHF